MIFGFNTDVKVGDTVYHVQSEARTNDLLLQTMVFVRGQCIGKIASSYASYEGHEDFGDQQMHEMLKEQHRRALDLVREGKVEVFAGGDADVQDYGGQGLSLRWTNAAPLFDVTPVEMQVRISDNGAPVSAAEVTCWMPSQPDWPGPQATTSAEGTASLSVPLAPETRETAVVVQARSGDKSVTRKFRLRKSSS